MDSSSSAITRGSGSTATGVGSSDASVFRATGTLMTDLCASRPDRELASRRTPRSPRLAVVAAITRARTGERLARAERTATRPLFSVSARPRAATLTRLIRAAGFVPFAVRRSAADRRLSVVCFFSTRGALAAVRRAPARSREDLDPAVRRRDPFEESWMRFPEALWALRLEAERDVDGREAVTRDDTTRFTAGLRDLAAALEFRAAEAGNTPTPHTTRQIRAASKPPLRLGKVKTSTFRLIRVRMVRPCGGFPTSSVASWSSEKIRIGCCHPRLQPLYRLEARSGSTDGHFRCRSTRPGDKIRWPSTA